MILDFSGIGRETEALESKGRGRRCVGGRNRGMVRTERTVADRGVAAVADNACTAATPPHRCAVGQSSMEQRRLYLVDWAEAVAGPPEFDAAFFIQSIAVESPSIPRLFSDGIRRLIPGMRRPWKQRFVLRRRFLRTGHGFRNCRPCRGFADLSGDSWSSPWDGRCEGS